MGNRKLEATRWLQRIAALPYNPYFEEEVNKIRQKHAIPNAIPPNADYPLLEPPVKQDIKVLMQRFRLPMRTLFYVSLYTAFPDTHSSRKEILAPLSRGGLFEPSVECKIDLKAQVPGLMITIWGFDPWMTKKQWEQVWDSRVRFELENARRAYGEESGMGEAVVKRPSKGEYGEQMQRWSEWYQLSEIQGLGPTKALERWLEGHPDQHNKYDASTVAHAIREFEEIIKPVPIKD